jgi:hypothetical protein
VTALNFPPLLAGVLRPMVLVPARLVHRLSDRQTELVLAHELVHLRRMDNLLLLLQRLAEMVLFFHPVVWLAGWALRREAEHACDDAVLEAWSAPGAYADSLTRVAELRSAGVRRVLISTFAASESNFAQRVRRILDSRPGRGATWLTAASVAALIVIGCVGLPTASDTSRASEPADRRGAADSENKDSKEDNRMTHTATSKITREGDRVLIQDVPRPKGANSTLASLTAVMQSQGQDVTYEQMMGMSGRAFRLQFSWCPSCPHAMVGFDVFERALAATGWTHEPLAGKYHQAHTAQGVTEADRRATQAAVRASIDAGVPVLASSEECGVIVGYETPSDESPTGWLHRGGPLPPAQDGEPYVRPGKDWPWNAIVLKRAGEQMDAKQAAVGAITFGLRCARTSAYGKGAVGLAAWDKWIGELEKVEAIIEASCAELAAAGRASEDAAFGVQLGNAWTYESLYDARKAAAVYLRGIAALFEEDTAKALNEAADQYAAVAETLCPECFTRIAPYPWMKDTPWTPERKRQAELLTKALVHERKAIAALEQALTAEGVDVAALEPLPAPPAPAGAMTTVGEPVDLSEFSFTAPPATAEDSFARTLREAARLLGEQIDLTTLQGTTGNCFAPTVCTGESCMAWWHIQTQHLSRDLVARRYGLTLEPLRDVDHLSDPAWPEGDPAAQDRWLREYHRVPHVETLREAMASGRIVLAANDWDWKHHGLGWYAWGVVVDVRDDATILGACFNGRRDNPLRGVFTALVVGTMDYHLPPKQCDIEALKRAVARIHGNAEPFVSGEEHKFGLDAIDAMIEQMKTVPGYCPECQESAQRGWSCALSNFSQMRNGAVAAAKYLRSLRDSFNDEADEPLLAAAREYDRITELLAPAMDRDSDAHVSKTVGTLEGQEPHVRRLEQVKGALAKAADKLTRALRAEGADVTEPPADR